MFAHIPPFRRLAVCVLLVIFAAGVLACGGIGEKPVEVSTVKLNEKFVFNHSTWVILEAKDVGKLLKAPNPKDQDKKTAGRFILVRFQVTNTEKQPDSLGNDPVLVDERGEQFDALSEQKQYLPKGARTVGETDSDPLPGGMTREFFALYNVPAEAKGLRLHQRLFQQEGFVELGL